ncbi:cation diffusion facilitator family transporter [Peribacillus frigoritolerans]|uniref:cation diffusion facilitator family transporter n=1 Tax=Peribacillus frigoritolerans TaxID=450367 RepID=UPI0007BFA7AB|nr:cation transporter [Peribacillus frigoritolerans]PRS32255.1 cation transporter [Bacillus sp. RJGP41]QNK49997.1 cation transporter [Brevibacterium sp. PAMC23299]MDG4849612.1 cation transporter [Peribacillus frigoritolerans]TWD93777.1 putative Co/Zn/Cd cation transporter (cation efflux family) [Peribacillus frigoritolerans]WHX67430.1 cation transporter [Peribacillus frigoritolerans]
MNTEQRILRVSIGVTIFVACFGIIFGLLSGSFSITFDGFYSLTDAIMSVLALIVSKLITSSTAPNRQNGKLSERFTMGFWHLEPIVLGLNGVMLMGAAVYALINAIGSLMTGGRNLEFGFAIVYAVVTMIACCSMAIFETRLNKTLSSDFVALDAKAWMMTGGITAALLIAFCIGYAFEGTNLEWLTPYIDPAVLVLICLVIIPLPISTVKRALADVLLITPQSLKQHVDEVAQDFVKRYGFVSYRAYVAKVGRGKQIELYFIVPGGWPAKCLEEWDAIRDEIGNAIGEESTDRWLTIVFTTDVEWAD